jgi:hypothetical protein
MREAILSNEREREAIVIKSIFNVKGFFATFRENASTDIDPRCDDEKKKNS